MFLPKRIMKTFREYVEKKEIPQFLYHATYKPYLNSIKKKGLTINNKKNWSDSRNVIYLAKDKDVAESYAETNDVVPEEYLDQIIILKINTKNLDKNKIDLDKNVRDNNGDTLEYKGNIPFKEITIL